MTVSVVSHSQTGLINIEKANYYGDNNDNVNNTDSKITSKIEPITISTKMNNEITDQVQVSVKAPVQPQSYPIITNINHREEFMITTCGKLKHKHTRCIKRAGVVPYRLYNCVPHFLLAVDNKYKELTPFAGSVSKKRDKDPIDTAIKELAEETLGLIKLKRKDVINSVVMINGINMIIFAHIPLDMDMIVNKFKEEAKKRTRIENSNVVWLSGQEFEDAVNDNYPIPMYENSMIFFRRIKDFFSWL